MSTQDEITTIIHDEEIQFVDLWFTDILGAVKNVTVPSERFEHVVHHGVPIDGSALDGSARVAESDMVLKPDLSTFAILPWQQNDKRTARIICTVQTPQGEDFIGDPRIVLIKTLQQAEEMGYRFKTGMEMEFFLFSMGDDGKPVVGHTHDEAGYFDLAEDTTQTVRQIMISTLSAMGIEVESTHSEIGIGQHEIDLGYNNALVSADQMLTARIVLKTIARQHNLHCTFMPRPRADLPGSGMHTHQTLHDCQSDENLFVDTNHEYGLSEIAQQFLAGQLHHARAMTAIVAPLINSYKRLGTSVEAPVYVSWAHINRAALIRVPSVTSGMETHTRLELRCPDPSSNPYLALAVMLRAGLEGIRQKMSLPAPLEETLLTQNRNRMRQIEILPNSLSQAIEILQQDDVILSALGPYISDRYLAVKKQELAAYNQVVTQWELDNYLRRY